ncbi:MAG: DUF4433 domain-containing protein [Sphingomonas sp.]|nr:DUF4433 domain-containing protein [Sphingomonas sp.]
MSREDAEQQDVLLTDVAPEHIIQANCAAHDSVRLYFRPRTPTQFNIEGIREPTDYYFGKHAPVLYMMCFDAGGILTQPGVRFSDGNMQGLPHVFHDDAGFQQLVFADIYHEGRIPEADRERVRRSRCAEVLVPSPLPLAPSLRAVVCRSSAERQLLLHELGAAFPARDRIRVFNEAGVFNLDYAFVETVDLAKDGVHVKFHCPRRGPIAGKVEVRVTPDVGPAIRWGNDALEFWKKWTFTYVLLQGSYLVEIWIRGCLAYRARAILADEPF